MYSIYIALAIFFLFSLFMPFSMILTSILLRNRAKTTSTSRNSYESAENSVGSRISIMNEYIHYFSMFIAFEVILIFIILWSASMQLFPFKYSMIMLSLLIVGFVFEMLVILLARSER